MDLKDDLSDYLESGNSTSTEDLLVTIRQDLKDFQADFVAQLTQDIGRLQAEKVQLLSDIAQLRQQKQSLQVETSDTISRQQLVQQQLWAKQLAQALATRLYMLLSEKIQQDQSPATRTGRLSTASSNRYPISDRPSGRSLNRPSLETERSLTSLDTALNQTLSSLKQDLDSYQSTLSQQISRMQSLEHQGEVILDALVSRLNQQLQTTAAPPTIAPNGYPVSEAQVSKAQGLAGYPPASPELSSRWGISPQPARAGSVSQSYHQAVDRAPGAREPSPSGAAQPSPHRPPPPPVHRSRQPQALRWGEHLSLPWVTNFFTSISAFQRGLILILLSTMALSLHNVVVGIIGNESSIFNIWRTGGFISLNSLDSSLLILWLRMLVVMPLMALIATVLYPATWQDIKRFAVSRDRRLLRNVIGSGFFLFLSQVLIYIAIGQIGPGVAVTILFMYPIVAVPLAWLLFGDRPTSVRLLVMVGICTGVILTAFPNLTGVNQVSWLGIGTAMLAGIAFAFYLISMQLSFRRLHPVPVSVIQFFTIFSLTSIILLMRPADVSPSSPIGLIVGGIVLGTLTLAGYLLNNFGVRFMGAARASIVASSGPVLTALLAFLITPGERTQLHVVQILGIFIVTIGVTALALERMLLQRRQLARQKAEQGSS